MNKDTTEALLSRTLAQQQSLNGYYISLLAKHFGRQYVEDEHAVLFEKLSLGTLRRLAKNNNIRVINRSKAKLVEALGKFLGRSTVARSDNLALQELPANEAKRVSSYYLYVDNKPGKLLAGEIISYFGKEWLTVEDIEGPHGYAFKIDLIFGGEPHTIYYDNENRPIVYKKALPKQVLFIEQFLRMVKEGGKVFTVLDTGVLSNIGDEYVRQFIYRNARIHAIVEFPHGAFKAAEANVKTAVVLLERGEPKLDDQFFGALPKYLGYRLNDQNVPYIPQNDLGKVMCDYSVHLGFGPLLPELSADGSTCEGACTWYRDRSCTFWAERVETVDRSVE